MHCATKMLFEPKISGMVSHDVLSKPQLPKQVEVCLKCAPFEKQHSRLVKQQKVGEHYERYHNPTTIVSTVYTNDCEAGFTATNDAREDYDKL
jgi:hypothetical protein